MHRKLIVLLVIFLLPIVVLAQANETNETGNMTDINQTIEDINETKPELNETTETAEDNVTESETETNETAEAAGKDNETVTNISDEEEPKTIIIETPELVPAGTIPDSPFYGLDKALERLQLVLTRDPESKAALHLKFAEERLAEAKVMLERNKEELAIKATEAYESELEAAQKGLDRAKESGKDVTALVEKINQMTSKHIEVLQAVLEQVPESAKPAIEHAINVSQKGREHAAKVKLAKEEEDVDQYLSEELKKKLKEAESEPELEENESETEADETEMELEEEDESELEENETESEPELNKTEEQTEEQPEQQEENKTEEPPKPGYH